MNKNDSNSISGFNFANLVQASRVIPEAPQGVPAVGTELPPTVVPKIPRQPFIQTESDAPPEEKPGVEILMVHHSKVFVLWRPWEECDRCSVAISKGLVTVPEDQGDHECPHNQLAEYKSIMDLGLSGSCIIALKEMFVLQNGVRCAHVEWLEPDKDALRNQKEREEEKAKNRVYPPDVDAAFAKK